MYSLTVQSHSSLQPPPEYNQSRRLWWTKARYDLFNHLGSYWNIMQFQLSSRGENRQRDTRVIKIRVSRKVLSKIFALSDAENNASSLPNRWRIADLPLLRTLLAITGKSQYEWVFHNSYWLTASMWQFSMTFNQVKHWYRNLLVIYKETIHVTIMLQVFNEKSALFPLQNSFAEIIGANISV